MAHDNPRPLGGGKVNRLPDYQDPTTASPRVQSRRIPFPACRNHGKIAVSLARGSTGDRRLPTRGASPHASSPRGLKKHVPSDRDAEREFSQIDADTPSQGYGNGLSW